MFFHNKYVLFGALALIVLGAAALFLFPKAPPKSDASLTPVGGQAEEPQRVSLTGTFVCLRHVDTEGPQTMECAFGIKLDDGTYYAVDFALMSQMAPNIPTGKRFSASGVLTPIERLSTDHWRKYPIKGIFSVTDSVKME
jgi:hypothetical protein